MVINPLLALAEQRGHLFGWLPVCFACGIGWYFSLGFEPMAIALLALAVAGLLLAGAVRWLPWQWAPLAIAIIAVLMGVVVAGTRSVIVAEPVLGWRYYGPIEGRIIEIDRSQSEKPRITLDQVRLARVSPARTPHTVRISLHYPEAFVPLEPGLHVMTTGHLSPPAGPPEPGGFDFRRMAWFERLGAVGYTRAPVLAAGPDAPDGAGLWIYNIRRQLSLTVQDRIGGEVGAFAAAITTGDRSGMGQQTLSALRRSNLAHLLAISGLHMGLLTGFIFALIRLALAAVPYAALYWPTKKIAAVGGFAVGVCYLALSGGNVATERAFIMVAVMFGAILLGRRALTLRAVAVAALIVLVLRPEALTGPGFQMSFAATTALVAVFSALRDMPRILPRWSSPIVAVVVSSAVAGFATAPFAAVHFNQISHYGLIANLLAVPMMGTVVMPAAVLAVCLAPFGLAWIGLWIMKQGLTWISFVAQSAASQPGAVSHVVTPATVVLALLALGGLVIILWRGQARWSGLAILVAALWIWSNTTRPDVLVADSGGLIGVWSEQGRDVNKPRGDGFAARAWFENDGQPVDQSVAAARAGLSVQGKQVIAEMGEIRVIHLAGKAAQRSFLGCRSDDIVILSTAAERVFNCETYDPKRLRETGSLGVTRGATGWDIITANAVAGQRPWSRHSPEIPARRPFWARTDLR